MNESKQPDSVFIKWRRLTYFSIFIGWGLYMLVRKSLPSSMQNLITYQNFTKDNVGMIASSLAFSYGISKFIFAFLSQNMSPRKLFCAGVILNGILCMIFPLVNSVVLACVLWVTIGLVQGFGWAPIVMILKSWYSPSEVGTMWSILSGAGNIASGAAPLLVLYITSASDWTMSFYMIGLVALVTGFFILNTIKNSPKEVGFREQFGKMEKKTDESSGHWYNVFFVFDLWVVAYMYACYCLVKDSALNWIQLFLVEAGNESGAAAAASVGVFQIGGFLGNLVSGYISDFSYVKRATTSPRAPLLMVICVLTVIAGYAFRTSVINGSPQTVVTVAVFFIGFMADAGIAVVGLSSMEVVPSSIAGGAHGLACAVSQMGSVLAGWPFAAVMGHFGWNMAYWLVEACSVSMVLCGVYLLFSMMRTLKKERID